jgi:hypothetical protein
MKKRSAVLDIVAELDRELHAAANGIGIEVHHGTFKLAGHIGSALEYTPLSSVEERSNIPP